MPVNIPRLRRWLAVAAAALICLVAASYFYARYKVQNSLRQIPDKIGIEIQQSAKGFTISKSFQGHTLFKIEASKAVQYREGGRGELHDVEITVYGRDSGRYDRIAGKDFEYDSVTGDVTGKGEVLIDLEANPGGWDRADQMTPKDLKNPVHLETTDLVFNQKTGNAHADGEVDFAVPQGHGSAVGLNYVARSNVLTLNSQIKVTLNGLAPISLTAARLTLTRTPRTLVLENPRVTDGTEYSETNIATVYLSQDDKPERVLAHGNVVVRSDRPNGGKITAAQLNLLPGAANTLREATFSGNVRYENPGGILWNAGRTVISFASQNQIQNVHADQGVSLIQLSSNKTTKQSFELTAPEMDFSLIRGRLIRHAQTSGPAQITLTSASNAGALESTVITAARFDASFDSEGRLAGVHGGPSSRIVSKTRGKPDRVSTSQTMDAEFSPGDGVVALLQKGDFTYNDGEIKAWADDARYTPQDQIVLLQGSPRVTNAGMTTSAQIIRLSRVEGTAFGEGDVKTTYTSSPAQTFPAQTLTQRKPGSDVPIHITAGKMTLAHAKATVLYEGEVRIWQGANSVEAPSVQFERDGRGVVADRAGTRRVNASLSQTDKKGKITAIDITADRLSYSEDQRIVHFQGNVQAVSKGIALTAAKMDCFLLGPSHVLENKNFDNTMALEKIVASGGVLIAQPGRKVTGDKLIYTALDDKFVVTGGTPSIFDAEHGNVTGVSLTLYGHDGRVLVEGNDKSPAVTEIRVAR